MSEKKETTFDVTVAQEQIFLVKTFLQDGRKDAELERLDEKAAYNLGSALIRAWAQARDVSPEPALEAIAAAARLEDTQDLGPEFSPAKGG